MDWAKIEHDIYEAASATFAELVDHVGRDTLYVFCLYTDSDGGSVVPSANTEEAYEATCKAEIGKRGEISEGYKRSLRWNPEEMKYCEFGADRFNAVSDTLFASTDLDHTVKAMTRALERLRHDEAYTHFAEPPVLYVSASDDDRAKTIEKETVRALNDPERAALFMNA
jgi:hypothetical protein